MVEHPEEYKWSSYHVNAHGAPNVLIDCLPGYKQLGTSPQTLQAAYHELFGDPINNDALHEVPVSPNRELVLSRSYLKVNIEEMTRRQTRFGPPGKPRVKDVKPVYHFLSRCIRINCSLTGFCNPDLYFDAYSGAPHTRSYMRHYMAQQDRQ